MSRDASVTLDWADGSHTFRLGWGELIKLQEECDAGPGYILQRLLTMECRVQDISSTIRLGLIGGGLEPTKALKMVRDYVESRPPMENRLLAAGILGVAWNGPGDEAPGKRQRRRNPKASS